MRRWAGGPFLWAVLAWLPIHCALASPISSGLIPAEAETQSDAQTFLLSVPAPRGLIVDRFGEVLATNRSVTKAGLLLEVFGDKEDDAVAAAMRAIEGFPFAEYLIGPVRVAALRHHWEHRRALPFIFTEALPASAVAELREGEEGWHPGLEFQVEYERVYPRNSTACHVVGYVSREVLRPAGPFVNFEASWPVVTGTDGLEKVFENQLRGKEGLLNLLVSSDAAARRQTLVREPEDGHTIVLALNLRMQVLAEHLLARHRRPSALVVLDADTGDVLVMASHPTYDISKFVPRITEEEFAAMKNHSGNPFFGRAHGGAYPPGSVFKTVVGMAALHEGTIPGNWFRYRCDSSLEVAGRTFRNWTTADRGYLNLTDALRRSHNVWFYKAALDTGSAPIQRMASSFGYGQRPPIELDGVASGEVGGRIVAKRAIANLAIGQGNLLVSPLQAAVAMTPFANGSHPVRPRLVLQTQTSPPESRLLSLNAIARSHQSTLNASQLALVRQGLWQVVNGPRGTGSRAQLEYPQIYGKTGTAEWTPKNGSPRWVGWFAGFTGTKEPRLAFAVLCESYPGEMIFGGRTAAPIAREFLATIYRAPEDYRLKDSFERSRLPSIQALPDVPTFAHTQQISSIPREP